jgi:DNA-binding NarL/FixJ family response regulator
VTLRIALVDDHLAFRERLRALLEEDPSVEIVAEAGDGVEILEIALTTEFDVACMDISMPRLNGIEATRRLLASKPKIRVIGLSAYDDPHYVEALLQAGAVGYFTKGDVGDAFLQAIHAATRERPIFGADVSVPVDVKSAPPGANQDDNSRSTAADAALSAREMALMRLIATGQTPMQIANSLSMDTALVDVHRRNIMRKLQLKDDDALIAYARALGPG